MARHAEIMPESSTPGSCTCCGAPAPTANFTPQGRVCCTCHGRRVAAAASITRESQRAFYRTALSEGGGAAGRHEDLPPDPTRVRLIQRF